MDTNSNLAQPQILVWNERNYDSWFIRMRKIIHSQDLWDFVTVGYPEHVDQETEMALTNSKRIFLKENKKKENKSFSLIHQGLTKTYL
jgi:hypothetical protein